MSQGHVLDSPAFRAFMVTVGLKRITADLLLNKANTPLETTMELPQLESIILELDRLVAQVDSAAILLPILGQERPLRPTPVSRNYYY